MKKWLVSMLVAVMMILGACGEEQAQNNDVKIETNEEVTAAFPVTVTDALGKDITMEEAPKKVVSMIASNTEILFALGLSEEIVGVNDWDNYPAEVEGKERIGGIEYNIEKIIALQPDLVVAHESGMSGFEAGIEQLEAVGITVFVVKNALTFEETYMTIEQIGQLTGKVEEAKQVNESIQTKLADIQAKVEGQEGKTAAIVVGGAPDIYTAGTKTFMDEMLKAINVKNIVQEEGWPMYSTEQFAASNPDTIIVTYAEDVNTIKNNPAFANMKALQNDAVKSVDADTTSRQGPRLADGVESMAKALYPDVFGE